LGALKALGDAQFCRMAAMENYCGQVDLKEQDTNRKKSNAKRPRTDALQLLIIEILSKRPDITAKTLPNELEKYKGHGVIEDVTEVEIVYIKKNGALGDFSILGLNKRLSRARKKLIPSNRLARKRP
jgi:hypothetical protein